MLTSQKVSLEVRKYKNLFTVKSLTYVTALLCRKVNEIDLWISEFLFKFQIAPCFN